MANLKGNILQKTEVSFPWTEFKRGTDVTEIECPGETKMVNESGTGTSLIIKGSTKDEWKTRGYDYLKRQISLLVANRGVKRNGYKEDPGFNIVLKAPGTSADTTDLREEIINAGWGTLTAKVDADGKAEYSLDALEIGKKRIISERAYPTLAGVYLTSSEAQSSFEV